MISFSEATRLDHTDQGFSVDLDPQWAVADKLHGGYLMAVLGRAVNEVAKEAEGAEASHPVAISTAFLRPPLPGPATVTVEPLRTGRRHASFRARLEQEGQSCIEALVTQGVLNESPSTWSSGPPPALPDETDCVHLPADSPGAAFKVPLLDVVEHRLDPSCLSFLNGRPSGQGRTSGWLRRADGQDWDPLSLLVALDPAPPVSLTLGINGWAPTLSLTAYLRRVPSPGPIRMSMQAQDISSGRMDETVLLWDSNDQLVAQASQLAGVRG